MSDCGKSILAPSVRQQKYDPKYVLAVRFQTAIMTGEMPLRKLWRLQANSIVDKSVSILFRDTNG